MTAESSPSAVVLVSGGMDSATAVYEAIDRGYEPYFLHVSYGQETESKEYDCARALADKVGAEEFLAVSATHLGQLGGSSLTDPSIAIADASADGKTVPDTYVPFRNANLIAMAVSYAEVSDCSAIFIGAHTEDFSGYPDCRPEFFAAFQEVIDFGTHPETGIDLVAPFAEFSKTDIARRGSELGVPYELTWSCYRSKEPACGTCDSCTLRVDAFQNIGERDPIRYAE